MANYLVIKDGLVDNVIVADTTVPSCIAHIIHGAPSASLSSLGFL